MTDFPWLNEAEKIIKENPEKMREVLLWVYGRAIANTLRAIRNDD